MKNKKDRKILKFKKLTISNLEKISIKGGAAPIEGYTYTQCQTNDGAC